TMLIPVRDSMSQSMYATEQTPRLSKPRRHVHIMQCLPAALTGVHIPAHAPPGGSRELASAAFLSVAYLAAYGVYPLLPSLACRLGRVSHPLLFFSVVSVAFGGNAELTCRLV